MTDLAQRYAPAALVTGASDGIGRAIAAELAVAGLDLILVARRADALESLAADFRTNHNVTVTVLPLDLSDPMALPRALNKSGAEVGLAIAAAGFGLSGALTETDLTSELNMIDVNCKSVLTLARWSVDHMAPRGKGGLMMFSSIVAFQGVPRSANYAATKAWNQVFAEGLAAETPWLDVLAVAPGPVATGFGARSGMDTSSGATPEEVARAALAALPGGGTVRPTLLNKVLQGALATLPRRMRTRVIARAMAPMMQGG